MNAQVDSQDPDCGGSIQLDTLACNGNGICEPGSGETRQNCPTDCSATCGDGVCNAGETVSCPTDCCPAPQCGDGFCDAFGGEDCANCPSDCLRAPYWPGYCCGGGAGHGGLGNGCASFYCNKPGKVCRTTCFSSGGD